MKEQAKEEKRADIVETPRDDEEKAYLTAWINIQGVMTPLKIPKPDGQGGPGAYETAPF